MSIKVSVNRKYESCDDLYVATYDPNGHAGKFIQLRSRISLFIGDTIYIDVNSLDSVINLLKELRDVIKENA